MVITDWHLGSAHSSLCLWPLRNADVILGLDERARHCNDIRELPQVSKCIKATEYIVEDALVSSAAALPARRTDAMRRNSAISEFNHDNRWCRTLGCWRACQTMCSRTPSRLRLSRRAKLRSGASARCARHAEDEDCVHVDDLRTECLPVPYE